MTAETVFIARTWSLVNEPDLESLASEHYPRILRAAVMMTGGSCDAEDLAQVTFLQALDSSKRFAGQCSVETWLYSILLILHRKQIRSKGRTWRRWLTWFERHRQNGEAETSQSEVEQDECQEGLWRMVSQLPYVQQHAIVLRFSENLGYQQIADIMSCPVGTVKSRIHNGLASLQEKLKDDETQGRPSLTRQGPLHD